jgi:pilus assembly protein Flp/PilA
MLFVFHEKGQGLVEYAIILALIAIVVIAIMVTLGQKVKNTFSSMTDSLTIA